MKNVLRVMQLHIGMCEHGKTCKEAKLPIATLAANHDKIMLEFNSNTVNSYIEHVHVLESSVSMADVINVAK